MRWRCAPLPGLAQGSMRGVPHSEDGKKPSPGMGHLSGDGFSHCASACVPEGKGRWSVMKC
jgi:hypothetical protein